MFTLLLTTPYPHSKEPKRRRGSSTRCTRGNLFALERRRLRANLRAVYSFSRAVITHDRANTAGEGLKGQWEGQMKPRESSCQGSERALPSVIPREEREFSALEVFRRAVADVTRSMGPAPMGPLGWRPPEVASSQQFRSSVTSTLNTWH